MGHATRPITADGHVVRDAQTVPVAVGVDEFAVAAPTVGVSGLTGSARWPDTATERIAQSIEIDCETERLDRIPNRLTLSVNDNERLRSHFRPRRLALSNMSTPGPSDRGSAKAYQ